MEGAGGECDAERRMSELGIWLPAPAVRNQRFLAAFVFERIEFSSVSTCEADGGEFNSPRRGEETRGRQLAARGDNSCEQYTVRTCHTCKHFRVWFNRSSCFATRTVLRHFARRSSSQTHFMSHAQCTWLHRILLPLPHSIFALSC